MVKYMARYTDRVAQVHQALKAKYPKAFARRPGDMVALEVGVAAQCCTELSDRFTSQEIGNFFAWYTHSVGYLTALYQRKYRYSLEGLPTTEISPGDKSGASSRLSAIAEARIETAKKMKAVLKERWPLVFVSGGINARPPLTADAIEEVHRVLCEKWSPKQAQHFVDTWTGSVKYKRGIEMYGALHSLDGKIVTVMSPDDASQEKVPHDA